MWPRIEDAQSTRTLLEINHDNLAYMERHPRFAMELIISALSSGNPTNPDRCPLPPGVTIVHRRHHTEPCPLRGAA